MALFYADPVHIVRGEGIWLYDASGKRYMDMYNNVPCVGHANPRVVAAMQAQAGTLNVHSRYLHQGILDYAERLTGLHAGPLTRAVFCCTGTEASEIALLMARAATGGRGHHLFGCGIPRQFHRGSATVPDGAPRTARISVRSPTPSDTRPLDASASETELTELYLDRVRGAIRGFGGTRRPVRRDVPLLHTVQRGHPRHPGRLHDRCGRDRARCGEAWSSPTRCRPASAEAATGGGYETTGFVPDIVTMGKPMGAGLPLAGVVARPELVDAFREKTGYFNTFASSPLQAAVGMAVLDEIEERRLLPNVVTAGGHLRGLLVELQGVYECMGDVRGHGLALGRGLGARPGFERTGSRWRRYGRQPAQGQGVPGRQRGIARQRPEAPPPAGVLEARRGHLRECALGYDAGTLWLK